MSNRKILVTGSSRGIGRAVAQAFAAAGDTVAIHHRDAAGHRKHDKRDLIGPTL
ncbi:MAG TPA: SDR family NAD(P)-dependent oxidoreductase [Streptosporangiaceae bacterium]|nr:SDR family NAD(P)-dependent oxidoreductase [Streptosporangiaceae bacterium]